MTIFVPDDEDLQVNCVLCKVYQKKIGDAHMTLVDCIIDKYSVFHYGNLQHCRSEGKSCPVREYYRRLELGEFDEPSV